MKIGILYIIFALIATIVNLVAQEVTSRLVIEQYELIFSIASGTLCGLLVKYVLDKKYIFQFNVNSQAQDVKTFLLYSTMGLVTTLIFWLTEFAFDAWFDTKHMRYTGAVIGLSIGYITKYQLDKKFVFVER